MHGQVSIGDGMLMASDYSPGNRWRRPKGLFRDADHPDAATARAVFDQLADGGAVLDPFKPTFFSPGFGMVQDRFGTHRIISALPAVAA